MTEPDNLPERVDALETHGKQMREEVVTARSDAAAARMLAAAADRDVSEVRSELRAHTSALNALRETQLEQGKVLDKHTGILGEHSKVLDKHTGILGEHSKVLDKHTGILGEHSKVLGEHSAILTEHTRTLSEQGEILGGHTTMLGNVQAGITQILELLTERRAT
ncbi:hypothetical protein [Haloechinothrix salitolerans]|uniref:Uncharacterized protein n=1 Tax=Haloechinothrix salitolerans TaxID=926830 RepID=A0ABW2C867_9PSEU